MISTRLYLRALLDLPQKMRHRLLSQIFSRKKPPTFVDGLVSLCLPSWARTKDPLINSGQVYIQVQTFLRFGAWPLVFCTLVILIFVPITSSLLLND